ncbi:MAG: purine-nucleoside phosphorylase [Clostridia bacterium]|nr:purine-nucleoside phosphorylase [Clostridia bacterium]
MINRPGIETYRQSAEFIRNAIGQRQPKTAVILGSGLDTIAEKCEDRIIIPYSEIPNFPISTVDYQKGELICCNIRGVPILLMNGRFHFYEGWEMWQSAYPVVVMKLLGIESLIISNASGGITDAAKPGTFVLIKDHIKLCAQSPLRGLNIEDIGTRFPDMQNAYDRDLLDEAERISAENGIPVTRGVYAFMSGPQYETPAEIKALGILGADVVGMSTVPEVIQAANCGIRVLCISCVSNKAAGITESPLTSEEVLENAAKIAPQFEKLVEEMVISIDRKSER